MNAIEKGLAQRLNPAMFRASSAGLMPGRPAAQPAEHTTQSGASPHYPEV